mmetsp:Transcript_91845/g.295212  ORF Transcript_91845/g.295212 Transcript_91845/m.295212 type:complete len:321 (+) Transcript_91845:496-1458(+)
MRRWASSCSSKVPFSSPMLCAFAANSAASASFALVSSSTSALLLSPSILEASATARCWRRAAAACSASSRSERRTPSSQSRKAWRPREMHRRLDTVRNLVAAILRFAARPAQRCNAPRTEPETRSWRCLRVRSPSSRLRRRSRAQASQSARPSRRCRPRRRPAKRADLRSQTETSHHASSMPPKRSSWRLAVASRNLLLILLAQSKKILHAWKGLGNTRRASNSNECWATALTTARTGRRPTACRANARSASRAKRSRPKTWSRTLPARKHCRVFLHPTNRLKAAMCNPALLRASAPSKAARRNLCEAAAAPHARRAVMK